MLMSHCQGTEQNSNVRIADKSLKMWESFKYLGMTVTDKNYTYIKIRADWSQMMLTTILFRIVCSILKPEY